MITHIENAVASFLTTLFAAADPALPAHVVRPATNKSQPPGDRASVVARCDDAPHQGGGLHLASIQVLVVSPAEVVGVTTETHAALEAAVSAAFADANQGAFNAAIAVAVPGKTGANFFADGWKPGIEGTAWQPYFAVTAGIRNSA